MLARHRQGHQSKELWPVARLSRSLLWFVSGADEVRQTHWSRRACAQYIACTNTWPPDALAHYSGQPLPDDRCRILHLSDQRLQLHQEANVCSRAHAFWRVVGARQGGRQCDDRARGVLQQEPRGSVASRGHRVLVARLRCQSCGGISSILLRGVRGGCAWARHVRGSMPKGLEDSSTI